MCYGDILNPTEVCDIVDVFVFVDIKRLDAIGMRKLHLKGSIKGAAECGPFNPRRGFGNVSVKKPVA